MKNLDKLANDMIYGDMVHKIASERNIDLTEARMIVSEMSFKDYRVAEASAITPPSGQSLGPTTQGQQNLGSQNNPANPASTTTPPVGTNANSKGVWIKGTDPQVGMTVSIKGPNGLPVPGQITQVDKGAKGVKVKNPTTQQDEWQNLAALEPYMAGGASTTAPGQNAQSSVTAQQAAMNQVGNVHEDAELSRMLELAGIQENCSGGATGAGAIAMAAAPMGKVKRREPAEEALKPEYTPKGPAKTVIGDTKPSQASGKLSADLAASGKVSAGRANNGRKRR